MTFKREGIEKVYEAAANKIINAILIEQEKSQSERIVLLHNLAVSQMKTLSKLSTEMLPQNKISD